MIILDENFMDLLSVRLLLFSDDAITGVQIIQSVINGR